jgi:FAD/FMN-containing dehydrogenase
MDVAHGSGNEAVVRLRGSVAGKVVVPDDAEYDEKRRVWNGMIERRPIAIVRAASTDDIVPVLRIARELGLRLAIRGGGHNVAGTGTVDDGIVLDLGTLRRVEVDPDTRLVRVEPGATLADVDRATEPYGLAVPIGVVSGTGIAGLTLGGGVGWLTRAYGLTIDNLHGASVITATGDPLSASAVENADLFWGLRGGGGNFGVVSSFTFRAHPHGPDVFAGTFIYELPRWSEALRAFAAWAQDAPPAITSLITFMVPPPAWELGNRVLMFLGFAWAGADHARAEDVVATLRKAAKPDVEVLEPTRWLAWQSAFDDLLPKGVRAYWKNASFARLDDGLIATLVERAGAQTWYGTAADLHHMGGEFGSVAEDATPFPNRSAQYWLNIYGFWGDAADDPARVAWVRGFGAAATPHAMTGQYVNFLGDEGQRADARQQALLAYGPAKFERLVALKRRYDPDNLLQLNHNIPPG